MTLWAAALITAPFVLAALALTAGLCAAAKRGDEPLDAEEHGE